MSEVVNIKPGQVGGISNDKIKHIARTIEEAKANAKDFTDSMNEAVKAFGEDGGHKKAIKDAQKLAIMEPNKFNDYWRSLEHYLNVLGAFNQPDMFYEDQPMAAE